MKTVYWLGYTLFKTAANAYLSWKVVNKEKLIQEGGVLIVANHESYLDPPLIGVAYDDDIHYLARHTLFTGAGAWIYPRWNSIPLNQDRAETGSMKAVIKLLKAGERVLLFPEGERTLTGEMGEGQAGAGLIASKVDVPIQPVRIFGARESFPRGSSFIKMKPVTIVVGDPFWISREEIKAKGKDANKWISARMMEEIGKIQLPGS